MNRMLSVREAAKILGTTDSYIYSLVRGGKLDRATDYGQIRVTESSVKRYAGRARRGLLSPTDHAIYQYIVNYQEQYSGISPTFREIANGVGLSSISVVGYHLSKLETNGLIRRIDKIARGIIVYEDAYDDAEFNLGG